MLHSFRIFGLFGIPIRIHGTLIAFLPLLALLVSGFASADRYLIELFNLIVIFGFVLLHELGHALTARRLDVAVRDITLLPVGGIAALANVPRDPRTEFLIVLAGPAVNLFSAAICALAFALANPYYNLDFVMFLIKVNLFLCAFNLIPCFPMDGGRLLRALLALRLDYGAATRAAARIGQGLAAALCAAGAFLGFPMVCVIAVFVFYLAEVELRSVQEPAREPERTRSSAAVFTAPPEWRWESPPRQELLHAASSARRDGAAGAARPFVRGVIIEIVPEHGLRRHLHN